MPEAETLPEQLTRLEKSLGGRAELLAFLASAAGALLICAVDFSVPAEIRLHELYVFPLAFAARYCARRASPIAVLVLTTVLQFLTYKIQVVAIPSFTSDVAIPFATSLLTLFLARAWRLRYLEAVQQASLDPLTGVANRRAFFARVDAEIARQRHRAGSFSLAVLDVNGFKALNDLQGHRAGDEALKLVAAILAARLRKSDSLGRIGGDEFGILMPDTDSDRSAMLRELCGTIASRTAAAGCPITISVGCRLFRAPPENTADALQQADRLMYEAKMRERHGAEHFERRRYPLPEDSA